MIFYLNTKVDVVCVLRCFIDGRPNGQMFFLMALLVRIGYPCGIIPIWGELLGQGGYPRKFDLLGSIWGH